MKRLIRVCEREPWVAPYLMCWALLILTAPIRIAGDLNIMKSNRHNIQVIDATQRTIDLRLERLDRKIKTLFNPKR